MRNGLERKGMTMQEILVVDDDPNSRKIIELMLSNQDYRLSFAEDGLKALEIFSEEKVDLVLLDLLMPRLDGFETVKRIRAVSSIPVIAISALAFASDRQEALEAGCDGFLTKPFTRRALLETLSEYDLEAQALA